MTDAITTHGLTKYYGRRCVVNSLDLRVPAGSVYGLLGRNGSGKSTTIKMLLGFVRPDRGSARLLDEDIAALSPATRKPPHAIRRLLLDEFCKCGFGSRYLLPKTGKHYCWNVDYLLDQPAVALVGAYLIRTEKRIEAQIGKLLENDPATVAFAPGLGANDIKGNTHLLRVDADDSWWDRLIQKLSRFLRSIGL